MKVLRVFLVLVIATVCLVSLATCGRILYYLEQVCKVYGTVTVAGTDPPTPLGSVEVFVDDYQYSELTNYYGDYEMEMVEGTWTINFHKDGYEVATEVVVVNDENQRVEVNVALVPELPEPPEIAGEWRIDGTVSYWIDDPPTTEAPNTLHETINLYPDLTFDLVGTSQFPWNEPDHIPINGFGTYVVDEVAKTMTMTYTEFWYNSVWNPLEPDTWEYVIDGAELTLTPAVAKVNSAAEPMVFIQQ